MVEFIMDWENNIEMDVVRMWTWLKLPMIGSNGKHDVCLGSIRAGNFLPS
jgi:hypothetical protein